MSSEEVAFYDALAANGSAKEVMGDDQLRMLAQVLVKRVRANTSVDWTIREPAQARLRVEVRRVLAEYHYPPDGSKLAMSLILEQAALYGTIWATLDSEVVE